MAACCSCSIEQQVAWTSPTIAMRARSCMHMRQSSYTHARGDQQRCSRRVEEASSILA